MTGYTFPQLIDFTRTSAATFVNSSGNIASTAQSRNLLTFTNEFANAAWTKTNATITANSTAAPDGTMTADTMLDDATSGQHRIQQNPSGAAAGTTYAFSVYAKAGTNSFVQLLGTGGSGTNAWFTAIANLATGAITQTGNGASGTLTSSSITSVGNGWYRIVAVGSTTGAAPVFRVAMVPAASGNSLAATDGTVSYVGTGTSIFIWGTQAEAASSATDYTRNFGGLFPPRFDYDPVTLAPRGLLIEEQRTNLLLRSEEFNNAAWSKINGSVTANATTSPDGTVDADLFIPDTANNQHRIDQTPVSSAVAQVFSVFVKASGYTWISLRIGSSGRSFNIVNGTVGTAGTMTGTITSFGNGWYRCAIAVPSPLANDICRINVENGDGIAANFAGDGTSGIFIYGAQLEAGAFATSYIPTVASQVTRSADVAAINAPNFASWFNGVEGSLVVEWGSSTTTSLSVANLSDGTTNNRITVQNDNNFQGAILAGGAAQASLDGGTIGTINKVAFAFKANDFALSLGGGAAVTDVSGSTPTVDRLILGANGAGSASFLNGHLRSIRYYPTRLSDAQLQALTA